jgi:hypothetical protein
MGARVIFNIEQTDGMYVGLYSHWGEDSRYADLAYALDKARPRWNDESYCMRIIISNLIGPEWNSETGFGLWASKEPLYHETSIDINMTNKTVSDDSGTHDWDSFCNYHLGGVSRTAEPTLFG